ncbi:MAG: transposase [Polyangiaceae bacterium]
MLAPCRRASTSSTPKRPNPRRRRETCFASRRSHHPARATPAPITSSDVRRNRYTHEERQRLLAEVQSSGDGVAKVAKRLGVTPSSAYLWLKEASAAPRAPEFARVVKSTSTTGMRSVAIEVSGVVVRVESGFDVELLRSIVAALGDAR